jgi:hypothetical protein
MRGALAFWEIALFVLCWHAVALSFIAGVGALAEVAHPGAGPWFALLGYCASPVDRLERQSWQVLKSYRYGVA